MTWQWVALNSAIALIVLAAGLYWRTVPERALVRLAVMSVGTALILGLSLVWARSAMVGAEPIAYPAFQRIEARILTLTEQPSDERVRIEVATRDPESGRAIKLRINVPDDRVVEGLQEGARVRFAARLMPPSPPLLPGAYDFSRAAWFKGFAATGSLVGDLVIVEPAVTRADPISAAQRALARHVRSRLDGSAGTIAAAFASGDRGAIGKSDEDAMRDAGLTHLLAISGLHVSAVIAAAYFMAMKLLGLWPALTLRIRLPLAAAAIGALAGIGYTLLTGAQVPTVRSCIGAVLVLGALALGREALSLRMVAIAATVVLALWPEALVGPSFQMSFAAVIAIVALHGSAPVREFLKPRETGSGDWFARRVAMLFATGLVIELALMPIVLFHFHRAGLYGAFANVIAIPLVTFVCMPLIAIALMLDIAGLGAPVWYLAGVALDVLLGLAHFTAERPGAVKLVPQLALGTVLLFVAGGLWLGLWKGKVRLAGFLPLGLGTALIASTPVPDILVTRDGRDVGITDESGKLFALRPNAGSYSRDNLVELAGSQAQPVDIERWPGARCSAEFCSLTMNRADRNWHILVARNRQRIDERQLAAACERAHIVIADRWLPRSCRPLWLKADRNFLGERGGTAIYLGAEKIISTGGVASDHGWERARRER